jgi:hypothetical protein
MARYRRVYRSPLNNFSLPVTTSCIAPPASRNSSYGTRLSGSAASAVSAVGCIISSNLERTSGRIDQLRLAHWLGDKRRLHQLRGQCIAGISAHNDEWHPALL